jgi:hypothetical protein
VIFISYNKKLILLYAIMVPDVTFTIKNIQLSHEKVIGLHTMTMLSVPILLIVMFYVATLHCKHFTFD